MYFLEMLGLYIHIPFCEKICDYCDFFTIQGPDRLHGEYLDLLSREISAFSERHPGALQRVETCLRNHFLNCFPYWVKPECPFGG